MPDILLIDDDRNFRRGLEVNLRRAGFKVVAVSNGEEGVNLAKETSPEIILCDVKMANLDGYAVKRTLNQETITASIPFIFLSALSASADIRTGLSLGADDFISKPFEITDLVTHIQAALSRKERADLLAKQQVDLLMGNLTTSLPIHTSHLFRTYLSISLLSLEMIAKNPNDYQKYLDYATSYAYRSRILVETLIWLNEYDLGHYATMDELLDLDSNFRLPVEQVIKIWAEKKLNLDLQIAAGVTIFAPARQFSLAVSHLVDNACKFSLEGGTIRVYLDGNGVGGCVLTVEDEGPGIPPSMGEVVFDRFYQIENDLDLPQKYGMGLGLYMARSFVRTRHGNVRILDSKSGCSVEMTLRNEVTRS